MIAEDNLKLINNWLNNPSPIFDLDNEKVNQLVNKYPFFVPAKWMQLHKDIQVNGFTSDLKLRSKLYLGNWCFFHNSCLTHLPFEKSNTKDLKIQELQLDTEETLILDDNLVESLDEIPDESLIESPSLSNYFQFEGMEVSDELPVKEKEEEDEKSLMVMMGFDEWLLFLKKKNEAKQSEEDDKAMLRSMWQREKLAAAVGEEDDNIPEAVFEMAINSIDNQDLMVSESLAELHVKQNKYEKAIEIYRKLSLQNPEKKTYFAAKINQLNKEKLS